MARVWAGLFLVLASLFAAQAALAEKRVALVVGNDKYVNLGARAQLQRAVNDARAVSQAFKDLGFEVTKIEDASRPAFNAKWQQFLNSIENGDVAAFYFSGHGIEIEGLNFLLPSDIPNIEYGRQEQIKRELISVSELLLDLKKRRPGVSLLILDASASTRSFRTSIGRRARSRAALRKWTADRHLYHVFRRSRANRARPSAAANDRSRPR